MKAIVETVIMTLIIGGAAFYLIREIRRCFFSKGGCGCSCACPTGKTLPFAKKSALPK